MEDESVRTCEVYRTDPNLPERFNRPSCFHGYGGTNTHPLYRTSNHSYGSRSPTVHEMPTRFAASSRQFSARQLQSGMYRDHGFNTSGERSGLTSTAATLNNRLDRHCRYGNGASRQDGNN